MSSGDNKPPTSDADLETTPEISGEPRKLNVFGKEKHKWSVLKDGEDVKSIRAKTGLSRLKLAAVLGLTGQQAVLNWETNRNAPSSDIQLRLKEFDRDPSLAHRALGSIEKDVETKAARSVREPAGSMRRASIERALMPAVATIVCEIIRTGGVGPKEVDKLVRGVRSALSPEWM